MMTTAGEREGEATARRRRGDGEATTRQRRGNKDAKAISYGTAGGRGNKAIDKRITTVFFQTHSTFLPHFRMTLK